MAYTNTIYLLCLLVLYVFAQEGEMKKKFLPPGMHPDMFPEPDFDPNAPECLPLREPCGFYSFSLYGSTPLKWVKSCDAPRKAGDTIAATCRCRCDARHECIYDKTDMKMRVYRQVCVAREHVEDLLTDLS